MVVLEVMVVFPVILGLLELQVVTLIQTSTGLRQERNS
jgi:hypothetical protein